MSRWVRFALFAIIGLVMLAGGLLVPAHLRAVDARVIEAAGRGTPSVVERGLVLCSKGNPGAARLLLRASQMGELPGIQELGFNITNAITRHPGWNAFGCENPVLERMFAPELVNATDTPFTEFIIRRENREKALEHLGKSTQGTVRELLRYRTHANTAMFSPSESASGQPLDAAISICGLLVEGEHFSSEFTGALSALAIDANHDGNARRFEQVLLDLMSLGQRFNWGQLVVFVGGMDEPETLRLLANLVRQDDDQVPVLFAAVELSGQPAGVAKYAMDFSKTGTEDITSCLRCGEGGIKELLKRDRRLQRSELSGRVAGLPLAGPFSVAAARHAWRMPGFALAGKWLMYLAGGFLLAMALHFAKPAASALERPLEVRGFHFAREFLFALGFLLVVLLLSEPFLAQDSQKAELPFRLHLPTVGGVVTAGTGAFHHTIMNQLSLLTLLLFFVLQSLIYTACLVKLAEIRRQDVLPRIKLKLLDNEDHLFDAGLYLGFVGTIISLILVSLGVIKPSLMAA